MFRTLAVVIVAIAATLIFAPLTTFFALLLPGTRGVEWAMNGWGRWIVWAAGIDAVTEGLEKLDPKGQYVLVANHHSYLDIPCLLATIPISVRFMAKASLFKVPIFGWGLQAAGFIPIDRKDRSKAKAAFSLAVERIKRGNSIAIFPEEGRSKDRWMRPFQRGAFLLAIKSELSIVPMAIDGTFNVLPVGALRIKPGRVTVRIGDPFETKELAVRAKKEAMDRTRQSIGVLLYGSEEAYRAVEVEALANADEESKDERRGQNEEA